MFKHFRLYPILCNYYITSRCNARCSFCNIYDKKAIDAHPKTVYSHLSDLAKIGISFIDFTGGEPLLHAQLPGFLDSARKNHIRTTVTTNCILYPKRAEELKGKIDLLHFSLDAPSALVHDKIRGTACFDKVMESIKIAKELGEKPDILYTVTNETIKYLDEMIELSQNKGLMLLINPVFSYYNNPELTRDSLYLIAEKAKYRSVYVNRAIIRFMKEGGNNRFHPRCRAVSTTIVISPDSSILLPCYHKSILKIKIENSLYQTWKSSIVNKALRMQGRYPFCANCSISCYFDPSFTYGFDDYFLLSQLSKFKYFRDKYI